MHCRLTTSPSILVVFVPPSRWTCLKKAHASADTDAANGIELERKQFCELKGSGASIGTKKEHGRADITTLSTIKLLLSK
jgi:hypothetical protein